MNLSFAHRRSHRYYIVAALLASCATIAPLHAQVPSTASFAGPPAPVTHLGLDGRGYVQVQGRGLLQDLDLRFDALAGCDATPGNPAAAVAHTAVGQLTIRLTSPQGTQVVVYQQRGGTRENLCALLLDDDGAHPSLSTLSGASGTAVFGTFLPESPLAGFDGEDPNGAWRLDVIDDTAGDDGTLNRFSLLLLTAPVPEIVVDVLDDPFPGGCTPGSCSLREAVATANARAGLDRILLPAGTLQLTRAGANEDANLSGDLDVLDRLELVGAGPTATIVNQTTADRVLQLHDAPGLRLAQLRIGGGRAVEQGGAIRGGGLLQIEDAEFVDNSASRYGGAIYHTGSGLDAQPPQIVLQRVRFAGNLATNAVAADAFGGALYSYSNGFTPEYARIEDATFEDNASDNGGGALAFDAVQSVSNIPVTIRRSDFARNQVTVLGPGGALGTNVDQNGIVRLSIEESLFTQNEVPTASDNENRGGAISMHSGEITRLRGSTFSDNRAWRGGAVSIDSGSGLIEQSTLCDNEAVSAGGAISSMSLVLRDSTLCDNVVTTTSTSEPGGGAIVANSGLTITRSTLDANSALRGGTLTIQSGDLDVRSSTLVTSSTLPVGAVGSLMRYNETVAARALALHNNLLVGRCSFADAAIVPDAAFHNLEAGADTCRLNLAEAAIANQTALTSAAMNLAALSDNGGPTPTRMPQVTSPAIDAAFGLLCSALDQRGYARADADCDIGAVEASGAPVPDAVFADGFEGS